MVLNTLLKWCFVLNRRFYQHNAIQKKPKVDFEIKLLNACLLLKTDIEVGFLNLINKVVGSIMKYLEEHISNIIRLSELAKKTDLTLDDLSNFDRSLGVNLGDPKWHERMKEKNIAEEALKKYLDNLSHDDLERVHAVMYSGRDKVSAKKMKENFSRMNETADDYRRTILQKKTSLKKYLSDGVRLNKQDGLEFDEF